MSSFYSESSRRFQERFQTVDLADRLEAVKWLGNEGSHGSEVSVDDLYDAFDLIADFLHEHLPPSDE